MQKTEIKKQVSTALQIEARPTRDGFGEGLMLAARENKNVVGLCADLVESTRMLGFAEEFPDRFFELGVAEQNMAAVAAGLGVAGKVPFIASYATFSPGRNWEQIRTTVSYNDSNVKIAGHHAGLYTGPDGATHQALEDIALMRALPNMTVIVPADAIEARKATLAAARIWGPVYLRFAREKTPILTNEETEFVPGKVVELYSSKRPRCLIVGCGPLLVGAMQAAKELEEDGIGTMVLNCHTIKPLDIKIAALAKKIGAVVTVEEHQIIGGLGGAVAELLAANHPVPIEFIGMKDSFGETGRPDELITKFGLDSKHIKAAVKKAIRRS